MAKLIMVEGIMGSGKTTTAKFIESLLAEQGVQTKLYVEGNLEHPADYDAVACLDQDEYEKLLSEQAEHRSLLESLAVQAGEDTFFHYGKAWDDLPDGLGQVLAKYDVYDGLPLAKHQELLVAKWRVFAEQQAQAEDTAVFDCVFLQNPMCKFLAMHDAGEEAVTEHVLKLDALIQPLEPLVIYFYQSNIRETIERAAQSRSEAWYDFVIQYHTEQAYGQAHGLSGRGLDGFVEFLEMRQKVELDICKQLKSRVLLIDNSDTDWERCQREVTAFLKAERSAGMIGL